MNVSEDPKKPAKSGFRKPKGIPPKARQTAIGGPQRATPFPRSQPAEDPDSEGLTVPELDYRRRKALDMPVPTSQNQRATQMLTSRTDVDSAAPTLLDPRPVSRPPADPAAGTRRTVRPWRKPSPASYGRKLREQMEAQLQARVVALTAEAPRPASNELEEHTAQEQVEQPISDEYVTYQVASDKDQDTRQTIPDPPAAREPDPAQDPPDPEASKVKGEQGEAEMPLLPEDAQEEKSTPQLSEEVVDGQTLVWIQGEPTPLGVPYDEVPPHDLEGVDVYAQKHTEGSVPRRDYDEAPTATFESPWRPREDQDLMTVDGQAGMDPRPTYELDDQRITDPRILGGPHRVEIRQVTSVRPDARLVLLTAPSTPAAEQYRVLSLKLKENVHVRSIGVMSPTEDVEAEVLGANLALALAEGNRSRVCLVDGDMRQSSMTRLLGLKEGPSLAEQVRLHRRDPDAPWVALGMGPSFHLIPGTKRDPNPAELLNSEAVLDLMDELRREFDFIVITTPPLLDSADGVILQEHSDGVILAARACVTRQDAMKASLKHLTEGKVLGTVLVDVPKMPRM